MRWLTLLVLLLLLSACGNDDVPRPPREPAPRARITVTGTGLFKVEPPALAALGWSTESPLALTMNDAPWPYQRFDGALYFYLPETLPERYSAQHILWLMHGEEDQTPTPAPPAETRITDLLAEQRATRNELYNPKYIGDPWFWQTLMPQEPVTHEIATYGREAGPVQITLRVAGATRADHQLDLHAQGVLAGTLAWSGDGRHEETLTVELPAGDALSLSLLVPEREQAGPVDISLLDEIVVRYPSAPLASQGMFQGIAREWGVLTLDQLASEEIIAWELEPLRPLAIWQGSVAVAGHSPLLVMERRLAQPATLEAVDLSPLPTEGADYLAIVAPPLLGAVEPLLAQHREAGLSVLLLTPQEIYDRYSAGNVEPLAIRALLREAQATWQTKPRFVLLVGDSSYDPAEYQSALPATYLPSPFIETLFGGETVSDNVLSDLDEDGYPDVALGRLPARSAEQLTVMVQKLRAYRQAEQMEPWQERVLLAADGQEAHFQQNSERVRAGLPATVESIAFYPEAGSDAAAQLLPLWNEGNLLVNYVGHGSVQQWGRDALLSVESVGALRNEQRLPIVINMTCLTGLFSHPSQESLAESLLWAEQGGAIAVIAPSSLSLPSDQSLLNEALLRELLSPARPTIGEALLRAKRTLPLNTPNAHDIVATFHLLGDPALRPLAPDQ